MDEPGAYTPEEEERLRQIEEELARVKASGFVVPKDETEDVRLSEIEQRAREARETHRKHTAAGSSGSFVTPDTGRSLGKGLQIAYAILGVPLVGFGIGYLIDLKTGGMMWRGVGTILGATAAVAYAIRSTSGKQ